VVGLRYPYAIETADEAAVITAQRPTGIFEDISGVAEGAELRFKDRERR